MTTPFGRKTLADFGFAPLLDALPVTCLDVGARGGFTRDLLPLAPAVRAIGFEPDTEECARLNAAGAGEPQPWRESRFIPVALGKATETRRLNIYRKRGCSSLLEADVELARRFGRDDYYLHDGSLEVPTTTADAAAREYGFTDAVFFKLDVQGAELEILEGSQELLRRSLLALRVEVSFLPIYKDQPLFADIDQALRRHDLFPMRLLELHPWRRGSKTKLPRMDAGPFPYSEGQMIHGDVLYMKAPENLADDSDTAIEQLLRAALLALAYGLIDHAMAIFERPPVKAFLADRFRVEATSMVSAVSRYLARNSRTVVAGGLLDRLGKLARRWS
jgi:FkbM family methyltransferase